MRGGTSLQKGLFALAILLVPLGTSGLAPSAAAAIALDIVNAGNGTKLGSIVFPAASGSTAEGVAFELNAEGRMFTQDDITSLEWDLDPQTPAEDSVDLEALAGDIPCVSAAADGPCSNTRLTLDLHRLDTQGRQCPPPPPPGQVSPCIGFGTFTGVELVSSAPAYACAGFEPPLADGPVTARGNRALPLKAELLDPDGVALTDTDLGAAPVVQVAYHSGIDATPEDVSDQALWAGQGSSGNRFAFSGDRWRFNLKVGNYTAPGTYVIKMISGDGAEYEVEPTCEAQFVINP